MLKFLLFLALTCALFFKQFFWLFLRLKDDDGWSCYLGIALTIIFLFKQMDAQAKRRYSFQHLALALLLFSLALHYLPHLLQCLALFILLYAGFSLCFNKVFRFQMILLLCFCLPWLASFQFYFGYPLRVICSYGSLVFFKLIALPVELKGVLFAYRDKIVYIDAPCSGIKMLYLGLLFALVLIQVFQLKGKMSFLFLAITFLMILFTNSIRYVLLFFGEAEFYYLPEWLHSGFGLILFFINNLVCILFLQHYRQIFKILGQHYQQIKNQWQKGRAI